ncbi:hypothetical protein FHS25_003445 [Rhizobium laguerreae]|uniref:Uncharacterized protein n=1 Tax=Rhizobium laguerreae TaxID=1076926 RepID=A0ABR6G9N7_9HYPH|nr:hypothetical protein [Rhizobium laguerreae]
MGKHLTDLRSRILDAFPRLLDILCRKHGTKLGFKRSPVDVLCPARVDIRAFSDVDNNRHQAVCHQTLDLTGGRDQERLEPACPVFSLDFDVLDIHSYPQLADMYPFSHL